MESVKTDKLITLKYTMKSHLPEGDIKVHSEERINFIFGVDRQVPSLERALEGCRPGDHGAITIPASEIYGEHDPSLVREIPKKGLIKQRLKKGQYYRQMKMGTLVSFKILEVNEQTVRADFNKPMAGIRVSVDFEVLAVRQASREEIDAAMETQIKKTIGCS